MFGATNIERNVPAAPGRRVPTGLSPCCTVRPFRVSTTRQVTASGWSPLTFSAL